MPAVAPAPFAALRPFGPLPVGALRPLRSFASLGGAGLGRRSERSLVVRATVRRALATIRRRVTIEALGTLEAIVPLRPIGPRLAIAAVEAVRAPAALRSIRSGRAREALAAGLRLDAIRPLPPDRSGLDRSR
jgi:hypothetical protein